MSTRPKAPAPSEEALVAPRPPAVAPGPVTPAFVLDWQEVAAAVFKAKGLTKGWYRIGLRLHFAALQSPISVDDRPSVVVPAGLVASDAVAIFETSVGAPLTYDAGNNAAPVPIGAELQAAPARVPVKRQR